MKQIVISTTAESEPVAVDVISKPDEEGKQKSLYKSTVPDEAGNTQQVFGLQAGETIVIT